MKWPEFTENEVTILKALFDTLIPPDDFPGGWEGGVERYLLQAFQTDLRDAVPAYKTAVSNLGDAFLGQSYEERVETIRSFDPEFVDLAATHAAEGYYSAPGPGWQMIGFEVTV